MEPQRKLVVEAFSSRAGEVREGEYVWALGESAGGRVLIERGERRFEVPAGILSDTPVPVPWRRLIQLDPCFERGADGMRIVQVNEEWLFRVLQCEHGNLFLEDTVTGIAWYPRLIFMGDIERDPESFLDFWRRHRAMSTDQIRARGIGR